MNTTVQVMGFTIYAGRLEDITIGPGSKVISTLNAFSYYTATKDITFKSALSNADILLPDGFPMVMAANALAHVKIKRIAGYDIFIHLLGELERSHGRCFFLGSSDTTLQKIVARIQAEYPNIKADTYAPPYRTVFSAEEDIEMIRQINGFGPDILFVGMTAPKQEKWIEKNKQDIKVRLLCSIGAVFDYYAYDNRPSDVWVRLNLEWLGRLLREPRRLWKRYLIYSPKFFFDLAGYKLRWLPKDKPR